jgi:hypothetical protein
MVGDLVAPVYDGEVVEVRTERDGPTLQSVVGGANDDIRARASMTLLETYGNGAPVDVEGFLCAALPEADARPAASPELLERGTVLGTQTAGFHARLAPHYLDEISEHHPAFRVDGLAHPGWLLRFANWALARTVQLGPWIHVSSDVSFLASVRDGDRLEVRGIVTDRYERKGHELVEFDVLMLADGRPALLVHHTAIWRPRPAH